MRYFGEWTLDMCSSYLRKRRVYLILAVVVLAGVLVAVFRREREPEDGGKRLSEWVEVYSADSKIGRAWGRERGEEAFRDVAIKWIESGDRWCGDISTVW